MVEPDAVPLLVLPTIRAHGVEAFGVLAEGFPERVRLLGGRFQPDPNRPLHAHMLLLPHFTRGGKAALLPSPEGRGLRAAAVRWLRPESASVFPQLVVWLLQKLGQLFLADYSLR